MAISQLKPTTIGKQNGTRRKTNRRESLPTSAGGPTDVPFPDRGRMLQEGRDQNHHREAEDHREAMPIGDPHLVIRQEIDLEIEQGDDRQNRESHEHNQLRQPAS